MTKTKFKPLITIALALCFGTFATAQTIESVTFSAVASNNDNFQPVVGMPYSATLSGANGSLEISASYGESTYDETTLSTEELKLQSSIRVYPNPSSYEVNVDLSQLPTAEYRLFLVDLNGKVVFEKASRQSNEKIDIGSFATGTYILQVQTANTKKIETFKIVKK